MTTTPEGISGQGAATAFPAARTRLWEARRARESAHGTRVRAREAILWAGCLVPFAAAVHLLVWYWPGAVPLDVTSGVWTALAKDFADGILYRPLFGPAGYGGTRYMPAFFMAHGWLIRRGFDPVHAGLGLTLASAVLFDLALYATLRELRVRKSIAVPLAVLGHASASVQLLTLNVKCDLLASAFNLAGLALALHHVRRPRRATLLACVVALVAAMFTKLTTVSGLLALVILLRRRRGLREAAAAAAGAALLFAAGWATLYAASDGRIWASFSSVWSGGGHPAYALRFPLWFALALAEDPCGLLIVLAALHQAMRAVRRRRAGMPVAIFWVALAVTVPVFASPGTDNNHLLDLIAASILLLGTALERSDLSAKWALAAPAAVAGLTVLSYVPGMISVRSVITHMGRPERRTVAGILARSGAPDRMLSENPLIPVMGGARPIVSDPFSLRILAASRPEVRADFDRRLAGGAFDTVVLVDWSGSDAGHALGALASRSDRGVERFYGDVHFVADFLERLERDYAVTTAEHPFVTLVRQRIRRAAD